ncbi:phasin family protein [Bradyrhizobium sp. WD16]|uniref:phasin family protein n=1 Tax=Bradyrhizobium sp. WD16 TaxID=1521768 RepID=UPI0020A553C1|nr:phasin family protein [Bradyrhizobium sp. WD16]UTD30158.1 phasin [Bradyrhizobium sp. WD16]
MPPREPFSFSPAGFSALNFAELADLRGFAEQGVAQFREGYEQLKTAAESGVGAFDAAGESALRGGCDYVAKLLEMSRSATDEAFDFAHALLGSASLPDALDVVTNHTRRQIDTFAAQSRDLLELGQKVAGETVAPIRAAATRAFGEAG